MIILKIWFISKEKNKVICHDFINQTMALENCPHEWFFINAILEEVKRNPELANIFVMFVVSYYPEYCWNTFNCSNYYSTLLIELSLHNLRFRYVYNGLEPQQNLNQAMEFGHIVTEFMIRYLDYSLVCTCGTNSILTSRSDCHKYFEKQLMSGFSLYRYSKITYHKLPSFLEEYYPDICGTFAKRPVFPTKELYSGREFIESFDGRLVSIPNYNRVRKCKF